MLCPSAPVQLQIGVPTIWKKGCGLDHEPRLANLRYTAQTSYPKRKGFVADGPPRSRALLPDAVPRVQRLFSPAPSIRRRCCYNLRP